MHLSPVPSSRVSYAPPNFLYLMQRDLQDFVVPIVIIFCNILRHKLSIHHLSDTQLVSNFMSFYVDFVVAVNRKHYCVVKDFSLEKFTRQM